MTLPELYLRVILFYNRKLKNKKRTLKEILTATNKLRWLDLGSSSSVSEGFYFVDLHPPSEAPETIRNKYFQLNIITANEKELSFIGKFDLIRMQHVLEHLTMEDGLNCLEKCSQLLNPDGYLLITVPDLNIFIEKYHNETLRAMPTFREWAITRIPKEAPESFYFSVFTHSVPHQQHLWCYDEEGLKFQIKRTGKFKNIQRLSVFNSLASIPFTHNRPLEDLCILAQKA